MLFVAFLYFLVTYQVDKFLFLNYYKTPPMLDGNIAALTTPLIPLAVFFHFVFGLWMLGDPALFQTTAMLERALQSAGGFN